MWVRFAWWWCTIISSVISAKLQKCKCMLSWIHQMVCPPYAKMLSLMRMHWHVHSGVVISLCGTLSRSGAAGPVGTNCGISGVMMVGGGGKGALSLSIALLRHIFLRLVLPDPGTNTEKYPNWSMFSLFPTLVLTCMENLRRVHSNHSAVKKPIMET